MLYINYKNNSFWDAIGECDTSERKSINGLYYCGLCACYYDGMEAGCQTKLYPTRKALWEDHCFEAVLSVSNEKTQPDLRLCFFDYGGMTEARVHPKEIIKDIKKGKSFLDAKDVHRA